MSGDKFVTLSSAVSTLRTSQFPAELLAICAILRKKWSKPYGVLSSITLFYCILLYCAMFYSILLCSMSQFKKNKNSRCNTVA